MPEEWAEVRGCSEGLCVTFPGASLEVLEQNPLFVAPVQGHCQIEEKPYYFSHCFLFPLFLWCFCHFSCTPSVSHYGLTPPPSLFLIIFGAYEFRQDLAAGLLRAERKLLDTKALFSLSRAFTITRMYWGFPDTIKVTGLLSGFWTLFHPFEVDVEEWTHHGCATQHLWLTVVC